MNQEHVLFFGHERYIESHDTVIDMARRWGIADPARILEDVLAGLARFGEFALLAAQRSSENSYATRA